MTRLARALVGLTFVGCASTPLVSDDGYQNPAFPYRIGWKDKSKRRLLGLEWRVRNIDRGEGQPTLKTGPEWESTFSLRCEADAADELVTLPSVDLAFTRGGPSDASPDGVFTVRTIPVEPGGSTDDLVASATRHVARLVSEKALEPWVRPGITASASGSELSATVLSGRSRKVAGRSAVQLELSLREALPGAEVAWNATVVLVFTGYRYDPDGPVDRTRRTRRLLYPVLMWVASVRAAGAADDGRQDALDDLLGRIRFGVQAIGEPPKARAGTVNPMGGDSDGFEWP